MDDLVAEYNASLLPALIAYMEGDEQLMAAHKLKFSIPAHPSQHVERMSILKAVTARADVPMHLRVKAKSELKTWGMESWDDGDVE